MADAGQITTAEAWREWKKRCAADRCGEEIAAMLRRFGAARFGSFIKKFAGKIGHYGEDLRLAEINDGWHLLETHACVANNRAGKRYKNWLFERADNQGGDFAAAMEQGATLLLRDVTRQHLRNEYAPAFMTSLNKPVGRDESAGLSLEELLPGHVDAFDEIAEREWRELAARHAGEFLANMDERQGLAIWARANGISFSDTAMQKKAKCSSALLHKTYQRLMQQIGATIKKTYPDEPPSALTHLACMIHTRIAELIPQK
jgi:hypothetical protein